VPSIAGPSALATVMLMTSRNPAHFWTWVLALTIAMGVTKAVLLGASRLQALLGERAIVAMERLMGLMLTAVAVQMLLNGVREFVVQLSR
jgi:small neutral amino acid transporter SnatA (MarC family)